VSTAYAGRRTDRPQSHRLRPADAPTFSGRRMRKHWRYLGVWTPSVSICAARVRVGPLDHEFWGVWERDSGRLTEHSRLSAGRVQLGPSRLRVDDRRAKIDLTLTQDPANAFEVITPVENAWTWTRKRASRARGTVQLGDRRIEVDGSAMLEDNDGYHPRLTHWWWAAGAGTLTDGRTAMWNAVVGLNDTLPHIENTIWIDGIPQPIGLAEISPDLRTTTFDDGNALTFHAEAERSTVTNLLLVRSAYRQPFGRVTGTLPGGLQLAEGFGVMEDHRAVW
jgi:hypothetical protein